MGVVLAGGLAFYLLVVWNDGCGYSPCHIAAWHTERWWEGPTSTLLILLVCVLAYWLLRGAVGVAVWVINGFGPADKA